MTVDFDLGEFDSALDLLDQDSRKRQWLRDGPGWVSERLGEFTWSKQQEILHSIRDNRRTAVRSCHGVGKSHIASRAVAWWLDTHEPGEAFVVTTAPTFAQVRAILWRYIRQAHRKAKLPGRVNQTEWHLDGELVAFGRKPSDHDEAAFQGIHAKAVLVVLDEASGIPEQLYIAADALTTNPDCRILAIGNPDNSSSYFANVCSTKSLWHKISISAFDSPKFTGEQVPDEIATLLIDPEWVEEKRLEWGEDNPIFRAKCLGEFTADDPGKVVRASDVAACRLELPTPRTDAETRPVELGIDVGGGGDETVIRERRGPVAGREWRSTSDDPADLAPIVLEAIRITGATRTKIDSNGVGRGLVGELRNLRNGGVHDCEIVGVNVGEGSRHPETFENLRAEIWWMARELSQKRQWDLSTMENADTTVAQLLEPGWHINLRGRVQVEKKDEIRKRIKRSPDNADALLLAYYVPPAGHQQAQDWLTGYAQAARRPSGLYVARR